MTPTRCLWYAFFSLSISPLGYIYMAETATVSLRAKTSGIAIIVCQGMSFAYNYIVPICLAAPALGTGGTGSSSLLQCRTLPPSDTLIVLLFVATATCVWILIFFLVPETRGRSFTELDELFARRIPAWKFAKTDTEESRLRKEIQASATNAAALSSEV